MVDRHAASAIFSPALALVVLATMGACGSATTPGVPPSTVEQDGAGIAADIAKPDAKIDAAGADSSGPGPDVAQCPLRHVAIPGVVETGAGPVCNSSECWLAFAGKSVGAKSGPPYGVGLVVGRWDHVGDKLNLGALSLPDALGKAMLAPRDLVGSTNRYVAGSFECGAKLCDFRCAIQPGSGGNCAVVNDQHPAKLAEGDDGSVFSVGLLAEAATGSTALSSVSIQKLSAPAGLPQATQVAVTAWPGGPVNSAWSCAGDIVVTSAKPCTVARLTTGGQPMWTAEFGPYLLQSAGAPMACAVVAADKPCTRLALLAWPDASSGGSAVQAKEMDLVIDAVSGQEVWSAHSSAGTSEWSYGGSVVAEGRLARWRTSVSPAPAALRVEWRDLEAGRLLGIRTEILSPPATGAWQVKAVLGKPWVAWYGALAPATDGSQEPVLGLADTWGNTTCETSGPCWQKAYADCADTNPCTSDLCDAAHGGCYHVPLPDGTTCSDAGGHCGGGVCK